MSSIHSSLPSSHSGSSLSVANTVTSTTALTAAYRPRPPQKDYAAAFASLQAQYGTSGDFPARATVPAEKKKKAPRQPATHAANLASLRAPRTRPVPAPESSTPQETTPQETEKEKGKASVSKLKKIFGVRLKAHGGFRSPRQTGGKAPQQNINPKPRGRAHGWGCVP
ncbi:hypothetical protein DFH09DRAFT_1166048 [Mycena vulgaris]|nr:hypothetical protein DFH09DRAFT_1166048 [Mycena vulgaris]